MKTTPRASLALSFFFAAASCAYGQQPVLDSEQTRFLTLINDLRAQNGAIPLQVSVALQNASQWMSEDMAAKKYFSHTDSLGRSAFARMAAFGYPYAPSGENIAAGNSGAQNTFSQWVNSAGHLANMLNPAYKVIGIGRAYGNGSPYGWYWTTDFGGVVDEVLGTDPPGSAPVISYFAASPTVVSPGQAAILSWNVSGSTTITIDNGVGVVTGLTSKSVVPASTTTYRLTATNAAGSRSTVTTVTVSAPAGDTQPPAAPATLWASAASSTRVNLSWSASVDNVGVAGYQVFRNGSLLTAVPPSLTSYADTGVTGNTTYSYLVRAYDAAGNHSAFSPAAQTTTPPPVSAPAPASVTVVSGSSQAAVIATSFAAPLLVRVLDTLGRPVPNVTVTFTAPATGASATFAASSNVATGLTGPMGYAKSPAVIANGTAGSYSVTASVPGVAPAIFSLTNTTSGGPPPSGVISIWGNAAPSLTRLMNAGMPVELGVRFRSDAGGKVAGVRFYKHVLNGGQHTGSLWSADGRLLATGTFVNETASGWQTLTFTSPVAISANTTYIASYHTSSGVFSFRSGDFRAGSVDNGPLHALQAGTAGPNGVFIPGPGGKFPASGSWAGDNYWVDVLFQP